MPLSYWSLTAYLDNTPMLSEPHGSAITYVNWASGVYFPNMQVISGLRFRNTANVSRLFWVGYSVEDNAGNWFDAQPTPVRVPAYSESTTQNETWNVPQGPLPDSGYFNAVLAVWLSPPEKAGAVRLDQVERFQAFQAFSFVETFVDPNSNTWRIGVHALGRSQLLTSNVGYTAKGLTFKLSANKYEGGEIGSSTLYLYGSYEAQIMCPTAPGSICTFFLYQPNVGDRADEIDIEIYNDGSRLIQFSTWVGGERTNYALGILSFDPSAAYHNYRIEFYPGRLSFLVDDHPMQTWASGLPSHPMSIMFNAWWPYWLQGQNPPVDTYMYVAWVRH